MQMTPEKIASEYRQAANKQKQIKILAELNLCKQREIVQILLDQGEYIPSVWHEKLQRPERSTRPRTAPAPDGKAQPAEEMEDNGRQTAAPEKAPLAAPRNAVEAVQWVDGVGPRKNSGRQIAAPTEAPLAAATLDEIRREAFRLMAEARGLGAEQYFIYSAGVMDLVARLAGKDGG